MLGSIWFGLLIDSAFVKKKKKGSEHHGGDGGIVIKYPYLDFAL